MSKHTPGPWRIGGFDNVINPHEIWTNHDSMRCPFLIANTGQELENFIPMDEANANARLIAAAPELLEACKLALSHCFFGKHQDIKEKIRQAITKAEA